MAVTRDAYDALGLDRDADILVVPRGHPSITDVDEVPMPADVAALIDTGSEATVDVSAVAAAVVEQLDGRYVPKAQVSELVAGLVGEVLDDPDESARLVATVAEQLEAETTLRART